MIENNNRSSFFASIRSLDLNFVLVILALNFIGLLNLYSATHGISSTHLHRMFYLQMFWLTVGWAVFFIAHSINYTILKRLAWVIYLIHIALLILVIFKGKSFYGAQRWLDLGFFKFQPSETIKPAIVILLATHFAPLLGRKLLGIKRLFPALGIVLLPFVLIFKQPDLGTALLIAIISFSVLFVVGLKKHIYILGVLFLMIAAPLAWNSGLIKDYQKERVFTFLNPSADPRGNGYNSLQSKIAVGSGTLFGKGFMKGTQSQLSFLPERHTDFIFSVLCEEHGFLGALTTLGLFLILFFLSLRTALHSKNTFGCLLAIGLTSILFWHFIINIGMILAILPVVGVPLPILSYGGSSLVTTMGALGLISSVSVKRNLF